jgi:methylmalonyl-CoA mutase
MSSDDSKLLNPFPTVSHQAWKQKVEKDLKGVPFEKLVSETAEGLRLQPLYVASDAQDVGTSELRRGPPRAPGQAGWDVRQRYTTPDPERARAEITADLARGVRSLWLSFDADLRQGHDAAAPALRALDGLACDGLDQFAALLEAASLDETGLALDAGGNPLTAAGLVFGLCAQRGVPASALRGSLGADPLGTLLSDGVLAGGLELARAQLVALVPAVAERAPELRSVCVSTLAVHEAGAGLAQEVGFALATGVTYLRWLVDAGVPLGTALGQIGFRVGVGTDFFGELAKLRALRECWGRVALAAGAAAEARHTHLHAVADRRAATRVDPWVNLLRGTSEAFSAAVAGADALTTEGFDVLLGSSDAFARRIAANAQTVLAEEAHVARVADPAGGSYYVEQLTDSLARQAWALLQEIETTGGMARAVLDGRVAGWIAPVAERTAQAVARRKQAITGVSEWADVNQAPVRRELPDLAALAARKVARARERATSMPARAELEALAAARGAALLPAAVAALGAGASVGQLGAALGLHGTETRVEALVAHRLAEPFERLRDACDAERARSGRQPSAFLCNLGAAAQHKARSSFAAGLLSAGGIAALDDDGHSTLQAAGAAFVASGASTAVICGSDAQYAELAEAAARELRARGAKQVWLAGRAGEREAALREAGISGFLFMGCDVLTTLEALLAGMGLTAVPAAAVKGAKS